MQVDLTSGGYQGDPTEEAFKPFTSMHMSFWWHFREVLRASDRSSPYWKKSDGSLLSDNEQRELVALSLLNYSVYTSIAESKSFFDEMVHAIKRSMPLNPRVFEVKRYWKAAYSSLYTSFNALSNIVCILAGNKSAFGEKPGHVWNYTPKNAIELVNGRGLRALAEPLQRCRTRLEIRDHLDHYWVIWHSIGYGYFLIDQNFTKGYAPVNPSVDVAAKVDACGLTEDHIRDCARDFHLVYRELSICGGFLDQYLAAKGWRIDYSDYGPPHDAQRPKP